MSIYTVLVFSVIFFILSFFLTYYLIHYAIKKDIIDHPNERSSHDIPTPRGGGLSIVVSLIACTVFLFFKNEFAISNLSILGLGVLIISIVGLVDDVVNLNAVTRAILYLAASATLVLYSVSNIYDYSLMNILVVSIFIIFISWLTNLFNFMDGADAIAGIQTIAAAFPAGLLLYITNERETALLCFTLAASTAGFLVWNWPPAKIFMGDVGSCTIGYFFGGIIVINYLQNSLSIYIWLVLLSFFIVDATLTLIKRMVNKEKWYQAHRSHAYQRYLQMGYTHKQLAIIIALFSMLILWPMTYLAYKIPEIQLYITTSIYLFLSFIWYFIQQRYKKHYSND